MTEKQFGLLNDVTIIRLILIVLLVFYHSFAVFSGAWSAIDHFPEVPIYWWLDKLSFAFMLESFVFVSGYVFGFQVRIKGDKILAANTFFPKKIKRLIIPCFIFSILYIIIFQDITNLTLFLFLRCLIVGAGHMWFLPMLFWCFVIIWVYEKIHVNKWLAMAVFIMCSISSYIPLPLRFNNVLYYIPFFYAGYIIQRRSISLDKICNIPCILALISLFAILFSFSTIYLERFSYEIKNEGLGVISVIMRISYSFVGLMMFFLIIKMKEKTGICIPRRIADIANLAMGIYLFHQFLLKILYYKTLIPTLINPLIFPWICFFFSLAMSILLTLLIRMTKVGRNII